MLPLVEYHELVQHYAPFFKDVFSPSIRGWSLSNSLDKSLTLDALLQDLEDYVPEIYHSDQCVQYAALEYVTALRAREVQISMAAQGEPRENGYAEGLIRTIKEEEANLSDYQDFADAYHQTGRFLEDVDNTKRIRSSLGYLTPVEFEAAWRTRESEQTSPKTKPLFCPV